MSAARAAGTSAGSYGMKALPCLAHVAAAVVGRVWPEATTRLVMRRSDRA